MTNSTVNCQPDTLEAIIEHERTIKPAREKWQAMEQAARQGDSNAILYRGEAERLYWQTVAQADAVYFERIGTQPV